MVESPFRTPVVVFASSFLPISGTFIHRQIVGVSGAFAPLVFCETIRNRSVFPWEEISPVERTRAERILGSGWRRLTGSYADISWRQRRGWRSELRRVRARLIHAHFGPGGLQMLPLARAEGLPLLVTFHGADVSALLENHRYRGALPKLFAYARCIAISDTMESQLRALGAKDVIRHYIGIPVERFAFARRAPIRAKVGNGETVKFLQVANFVEKKGHRYTLEAFAKLLRRAGNCHLTLAGDGPLREPMERMTHELGIAGRVSFVGAVETDEAVRLMTEADVYLHHSVTAANGDTEGLPTSVLEAMSTGLPVVATFHAGIPEAVLESTTGFLVRERDVEGYAHRLHDTLQLDTTFGDEGAKLARNKFNIANQNALLMEIYANAIGSDGAAGSKG